MYLFWSCVTWHAFFFVCVNHGVGVYMPVLPESLLDFIYAPVPFLAGIHKSYDVDMPEEVRRSFVTAMYFALKIFSLLSFSLFYFLLND